MAKSTKLKEDEYIELCNNINTEIENVYQGMKLVSDNYKALMEGDAEGPYWNGKTAKDFYRVAKANFANAITAYDECTDAWNKLYNRYITLCKKGYF